MLSSLLEVPKPWRRVMVIAFLALAAVNAPAQEVAPPGARTEPQPSPAPQASPTPSLERRFFANVLKDQHAIWTSPFRLGRGDAGWAAPLGLSTAVMLATDRKSAGEMEEGGARISRLRISRNVSRLGNFYATGGVAAGFYLVGRAGHNARARETGLLGAEALIDSGIVAQALKFATQRPRPSVDDASGEFFDRGNSFPSGHSISAWSFATVVAYEYGHRRPLVRLGAYGLATAVSLSRYTGRNHFLSDVLVGSAAGYGIGRFVYFKHHDRTLDAQTGPGGAATRSALIPSIAPQFYGRGRGAHAYGIRLSWDL
jgi:membrane-associated phospholipid phosphatase